MQYIDYNKIAIALPVGADDFGEEGHDFIKWKKKVDSPNMEAIHKFVLKQIDVMRKDGKLSKAAAKVSKALADEYDEEYN
jgi:U3 small nucleolar ribonucleoprotein component